MRLYRLEFTAEDLRVLLAALNAYHTDDGRDAVTADNAADYITDETGIRA